MLAAFKAAVFLQRDTGALRQNCQFVVKKGGSK